MIITVQLYPPLKFPDGTERKQMKVQDGFTIGGLLGELKTGRIFGDYSEQAVFAIVENDVAINDYVLQTGQTVKILIQMAGG
ncbi:hypothetical protein JCM17380_49720 [Desulfosporosinus burensis]